MKRAVLASGLESAADEDDDPVGDDDCDGANLGSGSPEHPPNTSAGTTIPTAITDRERVTRSSLPEASMTRKQRLSAPYPSIRATRTTQFLPVDGAHPS